MGKISKEEEIFLQELGSRINEIRKQAGITQVDLGDKVDMEKPNVNRLEKGKTNPTILTLKRICEALEIDINTLFIRSED